jgi:amidase
VRARRRVPCTACRSRSRTSSTRRAFGRRTLAEPGCEVVEAEPELTSADEVFHVLRALGYVRRLGQEVRAHRDAVKETVVWNVEQGLALDPERIARAQSMRSELFRQMAAFLERYDALALPASLVPPFRAEQEWVDEIAGVRLETYLDWSALAPGSP